METEEQMANINKEWHLQHKMPKCPTQDERIKWHVEHEKNCSCRPMPEKLRAIIEANTKQ